MGGKGLEDGVLSRGMLGGLFPDPVEVGITLLVKVGIIDDGMDVGGFKDGRDCEGAMGREGSTALALLSDFAG